LSSGIDFDIKERVKVATDIVDLLGGYLQLRRQGSMFVANCPWHDDRRPSFQINPARQTWTCWVCGIRGDVFSFVMRRENVEFIEALKILAERAGIPFTSHGKPVVKGSPDDKQILYKAMQWAQAVFHECLLHEAEADHARSYLASRNITADSIERFGLGFAPLRQNWLQERSRTTNFSAEILEACDLVVRSDRGSGFYERFSGRLMFPIFDTVNRPIAFGGRVVPGLYAEGQEPPAKYVNSRETKLFSKSDQLYGLNLAADESSRSRQLTVVEGYTDVIAVRQAGVTGVVAALGTAINQRHIRLLKRYADRVTLLLDGDAAGKKRTNEVLNYFIAESLDLRILTLPDNQDPCDFVQQRSGEELQALINTAPDAIEHKIKSETMGIDLTVDTFAANRALEGILETLAMTPSSLTNSTGNVRLRMEQVLTRLSREFGVDREQLKLRLQEVRKKNQSRQSSPDEPPEYQVATAPANSGAKPRILAEQELLELLLLDDSLIEEVIETVLVDEFSPGPLQTLYDHICAACHESREVSFEALLLTLEDPQLKDLIIRLDEQASAKQNETGFDLQWQLKVVLTEFERRRELVGQRQLISQLEKGELDARQEDVLLAELLESARQRKQISAPTDG
jgi:DNA primase